jgi:2-polyprenyl-6-methoxyphenol hydroxylase-like FAD-dependent oxidoreductase
MKSRVLVLGAGFGGLEAATMLSEALADEVDVTLIDKSDCFVFGYSKLDVMFGRATPEAVQFMPAPAPVTSSSGPTASAASTSTSSRGRRPWASTRRPPSRSAPRSSTSVRAAARWFGRTS